MEPFDTIRAEPRRFALGLPAVFVGSLGAAVLLLPLSFSLALAVLLGVQTLGFVAVYVPAHRRRLEAEGDRGEPGSAADPPPRNP